MVSFMHLAVIMRILSFGGAAGAVARRLITTTRMSQSTSSTALPIINELNSKKNLILGSASPRRSELLNLMGLSKFTIMKSEFAEDLGYDKYESAQNYCMDTALHKVEDVASKLSSGPAGIPTGTILIGADTIVEIDGQILEKPQDFDDAYRMMTMLSGKYQTVHTAVIIFSNRGSASSNGELSLVSKFVESTKVKFVDLTDADIRAYIQTREGFDKAGGYGIQGFGGQMVEKIDGCYFNVMGLPITALSRELARLYRNESI